MLNNGLMRSKSPDIDALVANGVRESRQLGLTRNCAGCH
jgi:hypothetical protein